MTSTRSGRRGPRWRCRSSRRATIVTPSPVQVPRDVTESEVVADPWDLHRGPGGVRQTVEEPLRCAPRTELLCHPARRAEPSSGGGASVVIDLPPTLADQASAAAKRRERDVREPVRRPAGARSGASSKWPAFCSSAMACHPVPRHAAALRAFLTALDAAHPIQWEARRPRHATTVVVLAGHILRACRTRWREGLAGRRLRRR